jgi:uncharacterized membrane protein YbhN (UPF0104 family)
MVDRRSIDARSNAWHEVLAVGGRCLPIAISALGIGFLIWRFADQWPALARQIRGVSVPWLLAAWLLYVLTLYVLGLRFKLILSAYQIRHSAVRFFALTLIGSFFSSVLPMSVGGDVIKAAYAAQRREDLPEAVLGALVDRGLGFLGVVVFAAIGLWRQNGASWIGSWPAAGGPAALVIAIAGIAVGRWTPLLRWIDLELGDADSTVARFAKRIGRAVITLTRSPPLLSGALILTLVAQLLGLLTLWVEAMAFGLSINLSILLLALPVIALATVVPSVNGIGVREAALVLALRGLLSEPAAFLLALTFDVLTVGCSLIGGGVFLLRRRLGIRLGLNVGASP